MFVARSFRVILFGLFASILTFGQSWAAGGEEELEPTRQPIEEVRDVIEAQLLAFQASDGPGAFFHAAPGIQSVFGDSAPFMAMVERSFNVIFTNASWEYEQGQVSGAQAAQIVKVTAQDGRTLRAIYILGRLNNTWKITSVQPLASAPS